jgi:hypothetical protein
LDTVWILFGYCLDIVFPAEKRVTNFV